jgi:hypothetical protein
MKVRDIFGLAIKLIGVVVLLQGCRNVVEALMIFKGYANVRLSTPQYWAAWGFIKLAVGVYLMVWSKPLVRLAFASSAKETSNDSVAFPSTENDKVQTGNEQLTDPRVVFGLIVKTIGLIVFLYGVEYCVNGLLDAMRTSEARQASNPHWAAFTIIQCVAGLAMMRWTAPLVEFAFPVDIKKQ